MPLTPGSGSLREDLNSACRWETVLGEISWKWCIASSAFLRTSSLSEWTIKLLPLINMIALWLIQWWLSSSNAEVESVECHLHALMCSVSDNVNNYKNNSYYGDGTTSLSFQGAYKRETAENKWAAIVHEIYTPLVQRAWMCSCTARTKTA